MNPALLLAPLIKEIGQPVAEKIWAVVSGKEYSDRLGKTAEMVARGVPAMKALHEAFGDTFYQIVNDAMGYGPGPFTYEAGRGDYITISYDGKSKDAIVETLRTELNVNLERIAKLHQKDTPGTLNYFKGVFAEWKTRFTSALGATDSERAIFVAIEKLLDGRKRTAKQIFRIIRQTTLGTTGALLIIQAVLIAMGVGVGIIAQIALWINGIPGGQVASFAILGSILLALAFIQLREKDVMTACVSLAYNLLDGKNTL
jgi:hypothetical protein